ncbi:hypothetical protein O3P69_007498 [Scylla paramamosain]|uniref:Uncharacterized protein n=1 Tax=Scylla paramamosain TaxID=85552 RepID=A0AAW0V455_SCYPA
MTHPLAQRRQLRFCAWAAQTKQRGRGLRAESTIVTSGSSAQAEGKEVLWIINATRTEKWVAAVNHSGG